MTSICPACEDENEPLGLLGQRLRYRCRCCGWQWSEPINREN